MKKLFYCCVLLIAVQFASKAIASSRADSSCRLDDPIPKHKLNALPTNDECSGAINVMVNSDSSCINKTHGTIQGATASPVTQDQCEGDEDDDVWYSFVATHTSHKISILNIIGSTYDICVSVWKGPSNALTIVPNSCPTYSINYSDAVNLIIGDTYYIRVNSYFSLQENSNFNVCVSTIPPPPINDECSGATALTVSNDFSCTNTIIGTTDMATPSTPNPDDCQGSENDDVWYSFVATHSSHQIIIDSNSYRVFSLWTGSCDSISFVINSCSMNIYNVITGLTVGQTYFIRVYSYYNYNVPDSFSICVGIVPPPPVNDECTGAIALTVNSDINCTSSTSGTIQSATASSVSTTSCVGNEDDDVWFSFVATSASHKVNLINIQGTTTDLNFSIWSSNTNNLLMVPNSCSVSNIGNISGLTVGNTYYLRIFSNYSNSENTTFDVCINTLPAPPINDQCSGSTQLIVNDNLSCAIYSSGTLAGATASMVDINQCDGSEDDDVWYSFVASGSSHVISVTNVQGITSGLKYSLWYGGDCNNLFNLYYSCSNQGVNYHDGLTLGETYYIRVYSNGVASETTTFDICVGTMRPPAYDECSGAIKVNVNASTQCTDFSTGSMEGATHSIILSDPCNGGYSNDIWFYFVALESSQLISLSNIQGNYPILNMSIWKGDVNNLTFIPNSCISDVSSVINGLTVGGTYYIRVLNISSLGLDTTFDVCVSSVTPPLSNDECSNSTQLVNGYDFNTHDIIATNYMATHTDISNPGCVSNLDADVWFIATVPASGNLTIETRQVTGSNLDNTEMAVFSGNCNSTLNIIACSNNSNSNSPFALMSLTGLSPNTDIYICVWRSGGGPISSQGIFNISAYDVSLLGNSVFDSTKLKYMPNPVNNDFSISYDQIINMVEIHNILGQNMMELKFNTPEIQLDLSKLVRGTYFVKIYSNSHSKTIKIIKE